MNYNDLNEMLDELEQAVRNKMLARINDRRQTHARIMLTVVNSERRNASKQLSMLNSVRRYLSMPLAK